MKFNKKKFNIILCFVLVLICATVSFIGIDSNVGGINADNNGGSSNSEIVDSDEEEAPFVNPETSDGENSEANEQTQTIDKAPSFTNAWAAYYYALEMSKKIPCYEVNYTTVNAKATNYPVYVYFYERKYVANKLNEVALINTGATVVDVSVINVDSGHPYTTYAYYNFDEKYAKTHLDYAISWEEIQRREKIFQYQVPYELNEQTADARISSPPKKSYYEIKMTLKPSAWKTYKEQLVEKLGEGCKEEPTVNSISVTIKIDKEYGTFISFESNEKFTGKYTYEKLTADAEGVG